MFHLLLKPHRTVDRVQVALQLAHYLGVLVAFVGALLLGSCRAGDAEALLPQVVKFGLEPVEWEGPVGTLLLRRLGMRLAQRLLWVGSWSRLAYLLVQHLALPISLFLLLHLLVLWLYSVGLLPHQELGVHLLETLDELFLVGSVSFLNVVHDV